MTGHEAEEKIGKLNGRKEFFRGDGTRKIEEIGRYLRKIEDWKIFTENKGDWKIFKENGRDWMIFTGKNWKIYRK